MADGDKNEIRIRMIWEGVKKFLSDAKEQREAVEGVYRDINGKLRDAQGKFVAETRKATWATKMWTGSFMDLRKIVGGYWIAQAVFQVGSLVKTVVGAGLSATATLENVQNGFTKMLKSKSEARGLIADLQAFADKTPFDDKQVDSWAQSLVGLGAKSRQVIPMLTALGNAVAGVGGSPDDVGGALTAIEQIAAKGRLQGDELLQLSEHKVFAQAILQKKLGLNSDQFRKALEGGRISSSVAIPMILKGLQEQYSDSLDVQSKGIGGLWSNVKAGLMRSITADPDSPFSVALRRWLNNLLKDMPRIQATIRNGLSKLWDLGIAAKRFADRLMEIERSRGAQRLLHDVGDALRWIWNNFAALSPLKRLVDWLSTDKPTTQIESALDKIADFAENKDVQFFFKGLAGYAVAMWALSAATAATAVSFGKLKAAAMFLGKGGWVAAALIAITAVGRHYSSTFRKQTDDVGDHMSKKWSEMTSSWSAFGAGLVHGPVAGFQNMWMLITSGWEASDRAVEHELSLFWQHTTSGFRQMWDDIAGWASSTWDNIINGLIDRLNGLFSHSVFGVQVGPHFDHIGGGTPDQPGSGAGATAGVGGAGQALLAMPRGGQLYPPGGGGAPTAVAGGGGTSVIEVHLDGKQIQARVNRRNDDAMARR